MKLTVEMCIKLLAGLRALDGRSRAVKDGDTEKVVVEPYKFSPAFVWMLTKNHIALEAVEANFNKARQKVVKDMTGGAGADGKTEEGRKMIATLSDTIQQLLDQEEEVKLGLITKGELALNDNHIPPSVLAQLGPILKLED